MKDMTDQLTKESYETQSGDKTINLPERKSLRAAPEHIIPTNSTITEWLSSCGGMLKISFKKWYIEFVLAPDRRYTPSVVKIESHMVDYYLSIWENCWAAGEKMMPIAPLSGVMESRGVGGLNIRVSRNHVQISMFPKNIKYGYVKSISSKEHLSKCVGELRYAKERAIQIQSYMGST